MRLVTGQARGLMKTRLQLVVQVAKVCELAVVARDGCGLRLEWLALGDKARVIRSGDYYYRRETFRIAGVIASPGLDIAISFFNAGTYFQSYAVGAIICTLDDADRLFGRRSGKLMLFNFDLPEHVAARVQSDSSQTIRPQKMTETEAGR